jgi:hypothetical protein
MKRYRAYLNIGFPTAIREETFEFEDDATNEYIEEEIRDWMNNYLDWGFQEIEDED